MKIPLKFFQWDFHFCGRILFLFGNKMFHAPFQKCRRFNRMFQPGNRAVIFFGAAVNLNPYFVKQIS